MRGLPQGACASNTTKVQARGCSPGGPLSHEGGATAGARQVVEQAGAAESRMDGGAALLAVCLLRAGAHTLARRCPGAPNGSSCHSGVTRTAPPCVCVRAAVAPAGPAVCMVASRRVEAGGGPQRGKAPAARWR